jgi:hypothetical protein
LFVVEGKQDGADGGDGHAQLWGLLAPELTSFDYQAGFERSRFGIKTGMQDTAISFADALADVEMLLDDANAELIAREFTRYRAADQPRANDQKIVPIFHR